MTGKRHVEIFTAGCPACNETVQMVQRIVCESCEVTVLDMNDAVVAEQAREIGVRTVPAVAINGELAGCCANAGPDEQTLREIGVGQAL